MNHPDLIRFLRQELRDSCPRLDPHTDNHDDEKTVDTLNPENEKSPDMRFRKTEWKTATN